ncbi:hypothetical protein CR513_24041, partial [Mucuna pruriens]
MSPYQIIFGKLRSKWDGPFIITNVFPYGAVELKDENTKHIFQINGYQIKIFHEGPARTVGEMDSISSRRTLSPSSKGGPAGNTSNLADSILAQ